MGDVMKRTRSRSLKWARKRIKELWDKGKVEFPPYATKRLEQRGLDANDIQHVIRYGEVTHGGNSEFPATPRRYRLEGVAVDGEPIVCIVDVNGSLVVVTAYPSD
jgi:hypothetical protein